MISKKTFEIWPEFLQKQLTWKQYLSDNHGSFSQHKIQFIVL